MTFVYIMSCQNNSNLQEKYLNEIKKIIMQLHRNVILNLYESHKILE